MNFAALMQLKEEWTSFKVRHPKFPSFMKAVRGRALADGTVLNSNLKLKKEDLDLIYRIHELI